MSIIIAVKTGNFLPCFQEVIAFNTHNAPVRIFKNIVSANFNIYFIWNVILKRETSFNQCYFSRTHEKYHNFTNFVPLQ